MKIPTDPKDIKAIREFLTSVRTQVCSLADCLSEPLKAHYDSLKKVYDDAIAGLPPTDAVPAAIEASHHLSCLCSCLMNANALCSLIATNANDILKKTPEVAATALNSAVGAEIEKQLAAGTLFKPETVTVKVTEAIDAKTKAGDLVPKETATQLCSAAKDLGLQEGEKKVRDEIAAAAARQTLINTRKATLQTCSLPIPDSKLEGVLAGTDDEFKAAQKLVEDRKVALQKKGVALNSNSPLLGRLWLPQDQYDVFESLATETLHGGNPLVTNPGPTSSAPKVMVC